MNIYLLKTQIFLSIFLKLRTIKQKYLFFIMKKKQKKIKDTTQASFYFEDYLETNKRNKSLKKTNDLQDRIYLVFFFFLSLIFIFCIKIIHISLSKTSISNLDSSTSKFILERRDIIDRNGILISRNINSYQCSNCSKISKR